MAATDTSYFRAETEGISFGRRQDDVFQLPELGNVENLSFQALKSPEDIRSLESEWLELEEASSGATFFQSWSWNLEFIDHQKQNEDFEPFVLIARKSAKLIALLPLALHRKRRGSCLTGLCEPYQQYTEVLSLDRMPLGYIFENWLDLIKKSKVDFIHLGQVRSDSNLYAAMNGLVQPSGEQDQAPFIDFTGWADFEAYHKSLNSKTRKNMRNALNKLRKSGNLEHGIFDDGPEFANLITRIFDGRVAWLERMGLTSRAFNDDDFSRFMNRLKDCKQVGLEPLGTSLTLDGTPIAEQLGFVYQGCYYAYMSTWNTDFEHVSPGKLHLGEIIKACYDRNLDSADFMIPAVPYKFTWAKDAVNVQDFVYPISLRGRLYNELWLKCLRPVAKRVLYKLSPQIRSRIFELIKK